MEKEKVFTEETGRKFLHNLLRKPDREAKQPFASGQRKVRQINERKFCPRREGYLYPL